MPGVLNDLTGRTFGRLKVAALERMAHGHAYWRCQCECGARPVVRGTRLTSGHTVSCGCQRADPGIRRAARELVSPRRRRQIAKMGARARHGKGS